jgi:hypothetical protein
MEFICLNSKIRKNKFANVLLLSKAFALNPNNLIKIIFTESLINMRTFLLTIISFISAIGIVYAQPVIDDIDMPEPNDTIIRTVVNNLSSVDYVTSDSNFIWDFSMIDGTDQSIDTFISVFSTPITYIATYSNPFDQEHKATVASPQPALQSVPGVQIADMYNFYKDTTTYFGQVGFGAEINSLPIPVKYDHGDILYRFPMIFGSVDSSLSQYSLNIPNLGYYGERKKRINYTDGWGTLYLPADTFEVIRVRSILQIFDSVYMDTLGFGFGFDRTETEFKWLAKGNKLPVFQVNKRQGGMGGNNTDAWFVDNRPADFSVEENAQNSSIKIYPNPAQEKIYLQVDRVQLMTWRMMDSWGRLIKSGVLTESSREIDIRSLCPGFYLLSVSDGQCITTTRFVKE